MLFYFAFQHTAARRRLHGQAFLISKTYGVSTHSRAKAAATYFINISHVVNTFQHTAARRRLLDKKNR